MYNLRIEGNQDHISGGLNHEGITLKEAKNSIVSWVDMNTSMSGNDILKEVLEDGSADVGDYYISLEEEVPTFDVIFNDETDSNSKGFEYTKEEAINYIKSFNGTNESYFEDYKGGTVSVVCNDTGDTVYEEEVR